MDCRSHSRIRTCNVWILAALLATFAAPLAADPPSTINIRGAVVGSGGSPTTGTRAWQIRFFDAPTGGAQLGAASSGTVPLSSQGLFNIPVVAPAEILTAPAVWYELGIDTDDPPDGNAADDVFAGRIRIHSVPFALQAGEVAGTIDAAQIGAGTVDNTEFGHVDGVTSSVQGQLDTNAAAVATNAAGIAANADQITSNAAEIATNVAAIQANNAAITSNTANIGTNATAIAANTTAIAANGANIANNATAIAANATSITTNAVNIAANAAGIASNDTDIAANAAAITTNTAEIASNDVDIAANATGIAANAAAIALKANAADVYTTATADGRFVDIAGDTMTGDLQGTSVALAGNLTASAVKATTATFGTGTVTIHDDIVVSGTGRIGIGTATPLEALDVNGAVRLTSGTAPTTTTHKLYNAGGALFWSGSELAISGGPIDAAQIAGGNVDNSEFEYLDGVTAPIQTQLDSQAASTTANASAIASNDTDIANNAAAIALNAGAIASNDTDIANLQTTASNHATSISQNASGVATNATNIAANASNIATNASNIANNSTAIGTKADSANPNLTGVVTLGQTTAPGTTTNRMYNVGGNLFWNGTQLDAGGGGGGEALISNFTVDGSITKGNVVAIKGNGRIIRGSGSNFGPEYAGPARGNYFQADALSASTIICVYNKGYGSTWGVAATISGNTVNFGAERLIDSNYSSYNMYVGRLSSTRCIFLHELSAGGGTCQVGTVTGNSFTLGGTTGKYNAGTYDPYYPRTARLDDAHFVVCWDEYISPNSPGYCRVGTVAGNSISWGALAQYHNDVGGSEGHAVAVLSSAKIVVVYNDDAANGVARAKVGTISGTSISYGAASLLNNVEDTEGFDIAALSPSQFVVTFYDAHGPAYARIGTVSGTSISWGTRVIVHPWAEVSVAAMSPTRFAVGFTDTAGLGTARVGDVSGSSILWGPYQPYNSGSSYDKVMSLNSTTCAFGFVSNASGLVSAVVGQLPGVQAKALGVANASGTTGQSIPVIIGGRSAGNHSSLTPGTLYYAQPNGSLSDDPTVVRAGLAVSATDLILDIER